MYRFLTFFSALILSTLVIVSSAHQINELKESVDTVKHVSNKDTLPQLGSKMSKRELCDGGPFSKRSLCHGFKRDQIHSVEKITKRELCRSRTFPLFPHGVKRSRIPLCKIDPKFVPRAERVQNLFVNKLAKRDFCRDGQFPQFCHGINRRDDIQPPRVVSGKTLDPNGSQD